jgi:hypothetical protein
VLDSSVTKADLIMRFPLSAIKRNNVPIDPTPSLCLRLFEHSENTLFTFS